jgi:hypothetical protein
VWPTVPCSLTLTILKKKKLNRVSIPARPCQLFYWLLQCVVGVLSLLQGGQFSGINRKVQLKPLTWSSPADSQQQQQPAGTDSSSASAPNQQQQEPAGQQQQQQQGASCQDQQPEQQQQQSSKAEQQQSAKPVLTEALLILKYGGVLTHAGRAQAEELGKVFRLVMYPR